MENNTENNLVNTDIFLDNINPETLSDCTIEARKNKRLLYLGVLGIGRVACIAKKICNGNRGKFLEWCKTISYSEGYVNEFIKTYEIHISNTEVLYDAVKEFGLAKISALNSLCEYEFKYYEDGKKLPRPKLDRDEEDRRKFNTYHMNSFIEQNKDNLEDITLQDLKTLVKEYKITNDLIKEKKQELKESEQKLAKTYEELATVTAVNDKIKYVQTTIGNIVTKLNVISEDDDYKALIKDEDIKKELEMNLVSARNKINDLLNEINLEKYNYKNIIDVKDYTTEG